MPDDPKDKKGGNGDLNLADNKEFKQLVNTVQGLAQIVQQGQRAQVKLQEDLGGLVKRLDEGGSGTRRTEDDDPNPDAINELDNAGLVKIILQEVGKVMDTKLEDVQKGVKDTRSTIETNELKREYARLSGEVKDFKEWNGEMRELAKKHPSLSLEDLYHKARRDNPTKAAEMDVKFKDESKDKNASDGKFMGLFPTSAPNDDGKKEKTTPQEAGEKAWDEISQQFPALTHPGDE